MRLIQGVAGCGNGTFSFIRLLPSKVRTSVLPQASAPITYCLANGSDFLASSSPQELLFNYGLAIISSTLVSYCFDFLFQHSSGTLCSHAIF